MAWTHLWPGDFMENTLSWAPQVAGSRSVREPWPDGRSAPIAMDDIARVAASVLVSGGHAGRALSLTGPEVLTRVELADRIGDAVGTPVEFVTVTRDEAVAELSVEMGDDAAWYVDTILAGNVGSPVWANSVVEEVTGRPATTFAAWARANAAAFRG